MNLDPYAKHDDEMAELLEEAIDPLDPEVQKDYLINILTYPHYRDMTLIEILKEEVKCKREMSVDYARRNDKEKQ